MKNLMRICASLLFCLLFNPFLVFAFEPTEETSLVAEKVWGVAAGIRSGTVVFDTGDNLSTGFLPLLYYQGDRFYLDGIEGGIHLYQGERFQFGALARLRFFDAPKDLQNRLQSDAVDWGGQLRYKLTKYSWLDVELLGDPNGRLHGNLRYSGMIERGSLEINPYLNLRIKSADFNNHYYALDWVGYQSINGSTDLQLGSRFRYHVTSNFYLLADVEAGLLDEEVRSAEVVDSNVALSAFVGLGVFNNKKTPPKEQIGIRPWLRLAHGFATPSSIGDILTGTIENDPNHNQLTSIFYGLPLTDEVFGLPLETYLTPGFVYHHSSRVQDAGSEFVIAVKAYYRFKWAVQMRLGLGTGLSWVSDITYQERSNNESKGYMPSNLLHYLDFSFDLNLGDLVRSDNLHRTWLGIGVHHRSAIFETAQQYGRIKGGSNYPMLYLQVDL